MHLTVGGGECKPQKGIVQLRQENVYQQGQADPDNQRPGK